MWENMRRVRGSSLAVRDIYPYRILKENGTWNYGCSLRCFLYTNTTFWLSESCELIFERVSMISASTVQKYPTLSYLDSDFPCNTTLCSCTSLPTGCTLWFTNESTGSTNKAHSLTFARSQVTFFIPGRKGQRLAVRWRSSHRTFYPKTFYNVVKYKIVDSFVKNTERQFQLKNAKIFLMDCPLSDVPYVGKIWGIGGIDEHEQLSGLYVS